MSEGPEDVEGYCKGFLFSIFAIASFKTETTSFTFPRHLVLKLAGNVGLSQTK